MVGLSIVLEGQKGSNTSRVYKTPQVINKTLLLAPSSSFSSSTRFKSSSSTHLLATTSSFLDQCFLCKRKLLPAKDIYMYKGQSFCSVECRQIIMDEEETSAVTSMIKRDKSCSMAAMRPRPTVSSVPSSSRNRKGTRNPPNGFTAY